MSKTEKLSLKEKANLLKRALNDIHKISPGYMAGRCAVQLFNALEQFIPIYLSGLIVDGISGGREIKEIVVILIITLSVGFLLQSSGQCFHKLLTAKMHRIGFYSDIKLNEKILNMDYTKIEDPKVQRHNDRIKEFNNMYMNGILCQLSEEVSIFFYGFCTVIGALITTADLFSKTMLFSGIDSFLINLSVPAVIIFLIVFLNIQEGKSIKAEEDMWNSEEFMTPYRISNYFIFSYLRRYQTGKDIRLYNQQNFISKKLDGLWEKHNSYYCNLDGMYLKRGLTGEILGLARSLIIYAFVAYKAIAGAISAGGVIKDVQSFFKLQWGINRMIAPFALISSYMFPLKRIYEFLDMPDEKYKGTIPTEKRDDNEYEFEFRHVWFKYPGSEQYVLKDINLKWKIGEKMALVGRNGCGKSTLVKLLCRLYDPTEGEITLNGIDIKKYKYEDYIALFSVVFQDSTVFQFSIADNVAAGEDCDRELVKECVIKAGLGDRLKEMENGIDTCLYKDFDEKGVEISGGEVQKLCLARAVYKGAPFIVLDEPTAYLDPASEHDIYTKFNSIVGTRTAIYISHRLSSCKFCDEITVMENGSIKEKGTHTELMERKGVYCKLWSAQAEYYKDTAGELFA